MATYYFSTTDGNDSRTSAQAQNPATPWQTITKLNSFFSSLVAGDSVLFKKGDVFYGNITVSKSGTSGSPITIGAYGTGVKPIITGFTSVSAWTNLGSNIWESTSAVSALTTLNMVTVNNTFTPIGRWPNSGYRTITSHVTNTSITDSTLTGTPNWTGGEVIIRKDRWIIDRNTITNHSGTTITYTSGSPYNAIDGYGYFIQNHPSALDTQNDWYYNSSTKKVQIYSISTPTGVQVSSIDNLVTSTNKAYITFDNLQFTGANNAALYMGNCSNHIIQNCDISYCYNGFYGDQFGGSSPNLRIQYCNFNYINNNAIRTTPEFSSPYIGYNTLQNIGTVAGMGASGDGTYQGMNVIASSGALIERNSVINVGYIPIGFSGNNVNIKNNYIDTFCNIKDDGGGIYTGDVFSGRIITDNIILNGIGIAAGTNNSTALRPYGIYLDDNNSDTQVLRNSVSNMGYGGIFLHNTTNTTLTSNTVYNSAFGIFVVNYDVVASISNMTDNIFFARTSTQLALQFSGYNSFGSSVFNNNYYARPIDDNLTITVDPTNYTLATWKIFSGKDSNSKKSPISINNINKLRFEYNATTSNINISLGANTYMDVYGTSYSGTITLTPFTSIVLMETGTAPTTTTTTTTTTSTSTTTTTTTTAAPTTTTTTTTAAPTTTTTTTSTTTTTTTTAAPTTTTTTTTAAPTTTTTSTTTTTTSTTPPPSKLTITPTNATSSILLQFYIVQFGFVTFTIFNSSGKIVYKSSAYLYSGARTKTISVKNFRRGTYKVQVSQVTKTEIAYFNKK